MADSLSACEIKDMCIQWSSHCHLDPHLDLIDYEAQADHRSVDCDCADSFGSTCSDAILEGSELECDGLRGCRHIDHG